MDFRKYTDIIFRSKVLTVLFIALIYFILTYPTYFFDLNELYIDPSVIIYMIFGFIFGPIGFIGTLIGAIILVFLDIVCNVTFYDRFEIFTNIMNIFFNFFTAYLIYKLWYTFKIDKQNTELIRLDSSQKITKFSITIFLSSLIYMGLYDYPYNYVYGEAIIFEWSVFVVLLNLFVCLVVGSAMIILLSKLDISFYKPKKSKINISPKIFDICLLIAIIIDIILLIFRINKYNPSNHLNQILSIIFVSLVMVFIFKPIEEIKDTNLKKTFSLTEKFVAIFIVLETVMSISISIILYFILGLLNVDVSYFWYYFFVAIFIVIFILYILSIYFLRNIESSISNPIESISANMQQYSESEDKIINSNILSQVEDFTKQDSEIGILANSYQYLVKNLTDYMENLEKVTKDKERIAMELNIAKHIQESMLPKTFPPFPDKNDEFDIYAISVPAKEIGGDFYDFFLIDEDHLAIVIGDVSGKGVPAALFMVISKVLIKNQSKNEKKLNGIFEKVNNVLADNNSESMFLTAWLGVLKISTGKLNFVNAGHEFPYLKHADGEIEMLESSRGFVLGGMEGMKYSINKIQLKKGDKIFLYTDGVTDAMNNKEEFFTHDRLINVLKNDVTIKDTLKLVKSRIDVFSSDEEQFDDITMLICEYKKENSK
ncbi:MAG: PP2C family protein-serine/threonine phosphatase [Methanobrevibacter sp.]|jgi:sigma-B regulation protein RsbU (phosphoserine phosphatase)|nr:PP2C family protein-serine/threonine phosphatase [Methanobrevibacter sp.]